MKTKSIYVIFLMLFLYSCKSIDSTVCGCYEDKLYNIDSIYNPIIQILPNHTYSRGVQSIPNKLSPSTNVTYGKWHTFGKKIIMNSNIKPSTKSRYKSVKNNGQEGVVFHIYDFASHEPDTLLTDEEIITKDSVVYKLTKIENGRFVLKQKVDLTKGFKFYDMFEYKDVIIKPNNGENEFFIYMVKRRYVYDKNAKFIFIDSSNLYSVRTKSILKRIDCSKVWW